MIFWLDCLFSLISTVWNSIEWFVNTDHSLPDLADDPEKLAEHDRVFKMESEVSILVLVILRLVHVKKKRSILMMDFFFLTLLHNHSFILPMLSRDIIN